ncbi:MAG: DUF2817 domain-containing protein [Chloroflexi bacterium]|nr:DUF2817 domain-containing protein [Chloroflexota bacterium]
MPDAPGKKRTRWIALIFTTFLVVALVAVTRLLTGCVVTGDPFAQITLTAPVVFSPTVTLTVPNPILTPTSTLLPPTPITPETTSTVLPTDTPQPSTPTVTSKTPTPTPLPFFEGPFAYGASFDGRPLLAYRFGTGPSVHAIIGAIHGGYEWNTVILVSETLKYLQENPTLVPDNVTLYIVPCANPDGYAIGTDREYARMNGNGVDLNRNWDYNWQPTATHGTRVVNAGAFPFSEPETSALRDFILDRDVEAAIFYHSAMARIFYGAEPEKSATYELAIAVSEATGYPVAANIPGQITTGDAIDWMSVQGLAGIEVELTNHQDIEWERNLQGTLAFLNWTPPHAQARTVQTQTIGFSVQGRPITVTQVGNGNEIVLVIMGSIHGDEANTSTLVRSLMEQYTNAPELVPTMFTLYFVSTINPDGLATHTRQNANLVDLNRNWPTDDWQTDAARTSGVLAGSGGTAPGSEPEVQAVSLWLLDVRSAAQEIWLLSYHAAYPPDGGVQPGYTTSGIPGPQADQLAQYVAKLADYVYLPFWPSEHTFTGELIHWCDVNGIWAADVELPDHNLPDTVPDGKYESTLATHQRVLSELLMGFGLDGEEQAE